MLKIFAKTFMNATRSDRWNPPSHWREAHRFDNRRDAEMEAHAIGRRRD